MAPVHQWETAALDDDCATVVHQDEAERAIERAVQDDRNGLTQVYDSVRTAITDLWGSANPAGPGPYGTLERIASHLNDLNQLHGWDLPPIPHPVNDHDLERARND